MQPLIYDISFYSGLTAFGAFALKYILHYIYLYRSDFKDEGFLMKTHYSKWYALNPLNLAIQPKHVRFLSILFWVAFGVFTICGILLSY